jgi:hypothetical protein
VSLPDTVRLKLAFADYFEAKGCRVTHMYVAAVQELLLKRLGEMAADDRSRRALLISLRQLEQLYRELTGRESFPEARGYLEELDALLAREREKRRLRTAG